MNKAITSRQSPSKGRHCEALKAEAIQSFGAFGGIVHCRRSALDCFALLAMTLVSV